MTIYCLNESHIPSCIQQNESESWQEINLAENGEVGWGEVQKSGKKCNEMKKRRGERLGKRESEPRVN